MIQKYNETPGRGNGENRGGDGDTTVVSLNNTGLQNSSIRGARVDSNNHRQRSNPRTKPESSAMG